MPVYLRWVQDAVVAHWTQHALTGSIDNHLQVALRHGINYIRPHFSRTK
jgi:acyl-CoA thioester hydrolase